MHPEFHYLGNSCWKRACHLSFPVGSGFTDQTFSSCGLWDSPAGISWYFPAASMCPGFLQLLFPASPHLLPAQEQHGDPQERLAASTDGGGIMSTLSDSCGDTFPPTASLRSGAFLQCRWSPLEVQPHFLNWGWEHSIWPMQTPSITFVHTKPTVLFEKEIHLEILTWHNIPILDTFYIWYFLFLGFELQIMWFNVQGHRKL